MLEGCQDVSFYLSFFHSFFISFFLSFFLIFFLYFFLSFLDLKKFWGILILLLFYFNICEIVFWLLKINVCAIACLCFRNDAEWSPVSRGCATRFTPKGACHLKIIFKEAVSRILLESFLLLFSKMLLSSVLDFLTLRCQWHRVKIMKIQAIENLTLCNLKSGSHMELVNKKIKIENRDTVPQ